MTAWTPPTAKRCGHSVCSQHFIDTGLLGCVQSANTLAGSCLSYLTDDRLAFDKFLCAMEEPDPRRALKMVSERHKRFSGTAWQEERAAWDRYACAALANGAGVAMAAKKADAMLAMRRETFGGVNTAR